MAINIEIQGIDKIKKDLTEIEESLDRIFGKYKKMAVLEGRVQAQRDKFIPEDSNRKYYNASIGCASTGKCSL